MTVIARDQFDGIMGPLRGGGASHLVLPAVIDADSFNAALKLLHTHPQLADSGDGSDCAAEATDLVSVAYLQGHDAGSGVYELLRRYQYDYDDISGACNAWAGEHIRLVIDHTRGLAADPWAGTFTAITGAAVGRLVDLTCAIRADGETSALGHLFTEALYRLMVEHAAGQTYRELTGQGPLLMNTDVWSAVLLDAVAHPNPAAVIQGAVFGALENRNRRTE